MDEFLHTLGAIDGIGDELVGFGIEFLAVALSEELDVAGDEPEGLLEVVRGDVGKLLEVAVGAFELGEGGVEALFGESAGSDVDGDADLVEGVAALVADDGDG